MCEVVNDKAQHIQDNKSDYYTVLGVSEDATTEEISNAYKTLALVLHPDKTIKHDDDTRQKASECFDIVAKAYKTLREAHSRTAYDNSRKTGSFFSSIPLPMTKEDERVFNLGRERDGDELTPINAQTNSFLTPKASEYTAVVHVETSAVFRGVTKELKVLRRELCDKCEGMGSMKGTIKTCPSCHGVGEEIMRVCKNNITEDDSVTEDEEGVVGKNHKTSTVRYTIGCRECSTSGFIVEDKRDLCTNCDARGWNIVKKKLSVDVPAGIPNRGHYIILEGQGHRMLRRRNGDVKVDIIVDWDNRLKRNGTTVTTTVNIPLSDALCGFSYSGSFFGEPFTISSDQDQVIQTGDTMTIKHGGIPLLGHTKDMNKAGDMHIMFNVLFPGCVEPSHRDLLRIIFSERHAMTLGSTSKKRKRKGKEAEESCKVC
jgi:molecular chaperone DnaJ